MIVKYGIPWAIDQYQKLNAKHVNVDGWDVRVEEHYGKKHAHWKKGGQKGSVNKDGTPHHKGESTIPPKKVKEYSRGQGFNV